MTHTVHVMSMILCGNGKLQPAVGIIARCQRDVIKLPLSQQSVILSPDRRVFFVAGGGSDNVGGAYG